MNEIQFMELAPEQVVKIGDIDYRVPSLDYAHSHADIVIINTPDRFFRLDTVEKVGKKISATNTFVARQQGVTNGIALMFPVDKYASRVLNKTHHDPLDIDSLHYYVKYLHDEQFAYPFGEFIEETFMVDVFEEWKQAYGYGRFEGSFYRCLFMMPDHETCDGGDIGADMLFRTRVLGGYITLHAGGN